MLAAVLFRLLGNNLLWLHWLHEPTIDVRGLLNQT